MSTSRYVGRHGSSRPSPLSRLTSLPSSAGSHGARAAAKTVAGLGIVLGSGAFVIAPSSAIGSESASGVATIDADTSDAAVTDLLGERTGDPGASRSATRTAAAVTAPTGTRAEGVHDSAGALSLDPVVKPKPKPKPKPAPKPVEDTSDEQAEKAQTTPAEREEPTQASRSTERDDTESTASESPSTGSVDTGNYSSQAAGLGLGPNAQKVYSAVRTQFPDMTNIGGYRAGDPGDHGTGNAVDIMVSGSRGDQVAAWVQANASSLNVKYVIWQQRIWLPGSGWRAMEDRGDPTQNHFDHVHVSVN